MEEYLKKRQETTFFYRGVQAACQFLEASELKPNGRAELMREVKEAGRRSVGDVWDVHEDLTVD